MLVAVVQVGPVRVGVLDLFMLVPMGMTSRKRQTGMFMSVMIVVVTMRMLVGGLGMRVYMVMLITE